MRNSNPTAISWSLRVTLLLPRARYSLALRQPVLIVYLEIPLRVAFSGCIVQSAQLDHVRTRQHVRLDIEQRRTRRAEVVSDGLAGVADALERLGHALGEFELVVGVDEVEAARGAGGLLAREAVTHELQYAFIRYYGARQGTRRDPEWRLYLHGRVVADFILHLATHAASFGHLDGIVATVSD